MNRWLSGYVATVVLIACVIAAQNFWELNRSDWASWAQAIGSVAAVGAAIWLASQEDRRRKEQSLIAAKLSASGMTTKLSINVTLVEGARDFFKAAGQADGDPTKFDWWFARLSGLKLSTRDEQLALIPLPNNCAYKLAGANDRLHSVVETLGAFMKSPGRAESNRRKEAANGISFLLGEVAALLDSASVECKKATESLTSSRSGYL
ncbi:hypothetical protein [Caballeronia telluris]|uniref:Lipoprotein n=1 Tax=Caballeronia telluris TaxID=326475 RepID=A0A158G2W4_9BURK|nr:hypothetical protein [Caballeronia telluris]SAL26217.1 hypothetical protein AWB66_01520 [Caballeronia telluris]